MNDVTLNFYVDDSAKGRYDMILGINPLPDLGFDVNLSHYVIESDDGTLKGYTASMVDLGTFLIQYLYTGKITAE